MSDDKSGSPPCGIYIRIDDFSDMQKIITDLRQMALVINRASGYEKNMHIVELGFEPDAAERITDLIQIIQSQGLIAIISGAVEDFDIMGADGILLENLETMNAAREALEDETIIGVMCGLSGDVAEAAIDGGADYITLDSDPMHIIKYSAMSETLCAAKGENITNENCAPLVRAGASFVDVTSYILGHEKGVMQGAVNILHALEMATQMPDKLH